MSEKQVPLLFTPGFSERADNFCEYPEASVVEGDRDYSGQGVQESWARQIGEQALTLLADGNDQAIVIWAHSMSTGPALQAAKKAKNINPNADIKIILDSPIGTNGPTVVHKLIRSAAVKTFRNLVDSTRSPYGAGLVHEQGSRLERFKRVVRDMGAAGLEIMKLASTLKEINYASHYDINEDLREAVNSGVDVRILFNNKDDIVSTNNPNHWVVFGDDTESGEIKVCTAPRSLTDENGELLAPVSTRADKSSSHDSVLYSPALTRAILASFLGDSSGPDQGVPSK